MCLCRLDSISIYLLARSQDCKESCRRRGRDHLETERKGLNATTSPHELTYHIRHDLPGALHVRHRVSHLPAGPQHSSSFFSPPHSLSVLSTWISLPLHLVESAILLLLKKNLDYRPQCLAAKPKGSRPSCPTYERNEPDERKTDNRFSY